MVITVTLLIIIVTKIIISLSKQVLFIRVSQKCFDKLDKQDLLYLFIWGGVGGLVTVGGTDERITSLVPCY